MTTRLSFDSVEVGDDLPALRLTLSNEQVRAYAEAADMPGGRFLSDAAAQAEGLPGQIVPGNLSLALFSRLLGAWGAGARLKRLSATFRALVRPNVPLVLNAVVVEKHLSDHGNFVECDLVLENADGDRLVTGTATVELT
ncbi:MAG: MaoC family dehydratase [Candidatus Binatia bacterium]